MIDIKTTEAFITVIDYLAEKFGMVIDTTSKDLMPYLQELGDKIVAYERSISIMWIIVGAILAIFGLTIFFIGCAKNWDGIHWVVLIICTGGGAWLILHNMYTFIGCNTFEEKIILDYISEAMLRMNNTAGTTRY